MYAVIATGGKQYKVEEGDVIRVEKLDAQDGAEVTFDDVIAICKDDQMLVGNDLDKASVSATVVKTAKAKKVTVYKYKRKTGYHKKNGHRQPFTEVKIDSIAL
ncbi:MAG: 50S ribosomal protein L21 [Eubacterium sp.]|nr:50S ribosomal protein L21 [Eubacterium sp.]